MRRSLGPVLLGVGAFFLVTAALLRFYAYPALAVVPQDQNSVTYLEAEGATLFDTGTLEEITTDLSVQNATRGDVEATEEAGDNIAVWTGTTSVRSADGVIRSRSAERVAFDATTGLAMNCCEQFTESQDGVRVAVEREGLVYKFPFGTEKETYKFWDGTVGTTFDATFKKESEIQGLKVYEFEMVVPKTKVGTREVPASVVGEDGEGNVSADVMYSNTRHMWVEPVTGAIVDRLEEQDNTLAIDGEDRVTTTKANLTYTDAQVKANVDDYETKASLLGMVHGLFPLLALLAGLLLVGAGFLVQRRQPASATD